MAQAKIDFTRKPLSAHFADEFVRRAFERAERDEGPQPVEPKAPKVLSGGQAELVEVA